MKKIWACFIGITILCSCTLTDQPEYQEEQMGLKNWGKGPNPWLTDSERERMALKEQSDKLKGMVREQIDQHTNS